MRANTIEFRLRMSIQIGIVLGGFWAPWTVLMGHRHRVLLAGLQLSRAGLLA